ncbi:hypothetical protein K488DRAFT_79697 [Vararia minispora EC-137]|uniref:Uncharacterized protein n=1 Tax=Vararia minispora EC-137 TaxID=1314806 RepID=A0ACB8QF66_9AGAM|nr:hypothetical protein K488DRAFT_79697 [Vararia minispora EC-137]
MQRAIVSYDDLVQPSGLPGYASTAGSQIPPFVSAPGPPTKKRQRRQRQQQRRNQNQQNGQYEQQWTPYHYQAQQAMHWDDPAASEQSISYDTNVGPAPPIEPETVEGDGGDGGEMSRILTHEEIWDDSALIEAWDSAMAEYEVYHGKDKPWKDRPVKKSPLWYNVPPAQSSAQSPAQKEPLKSAANGVEASGVDGEDSQPFDFATFVPDHDAALMVPQTTDAASASIPVPASFDLGAAGEWADRDEAFNRAMGAMYWAGYWTAVYHSHGQGYSEVQGKRKRELEDESGDEDECVNEEAGEEDDFVPTQR